MKGWGETTRTLISWRQGFRHPSRNECLGWLPKLSRKSHRVIGLTVHQVGSEPTNFLEWQSAVAFVR